MESFPLDQLPMLCIEAIAKYLSTSDLAALCAVSHGFREAFDIEGVWKRHYNEERVKYLLETPCKVEPRFVQLEMHKGDLKPMSEWRLAFIVENHLHNNWRQGKYKEEEIKTTKPKPQRWSDYSLSHKFLTNDYVIAAFLDRIEILDVRNYPTTHVVEPIPIPFNPFADIVRACDDKLLILYNKGVQIYELNFCTKQWIVKHSFFINEHEALSEEKKEKVKTYFNDQSPSAMCVIINHYLIAFLKGEPTFHIWNIETGVKVKEESSPVKNSTIQDISHSNTNLIVVVKQHHSKSVLFLAYNLVELTFMKFKETAQTCYKYCVFGESISIWSDRKLHIYNYLSNETIQSNYPLRTYELKPFGDGIIFLQNNVLKVFRQSTGFKDLLTNVSWFEVLTDKFIQFEKNERATYSPENIVEVQSTNTLKNTSLHLGFRACSFIVNKYATRYIVSRPDGHVLHFW